MIIEKIFLKDFRNFTELNLKPADAINIFLGQNAQGKTNILEAIHFASLGKSRAAKDYELIRWGENSAVIRINFFKADVPHELAIELSPDKKMRRVLFDGGVIRFRGIVGKLNSVMFSPEDLFMFKGAPSARRKFLDAEISQASPVYFANLTNYNRIVEQRNNLLKKIRDDLVDSSALDLWNEQFSEVAARITIKRLETVDKLNELANSTQQKISAQSENLSIAYDLKNAGNFQCNSSINHDKLSHWYRETLKARTLIDVKRGSTSLGPHLDDLKFFVNDKELRIYGSQGQMRTAALSLKLSELQFLKAEIGEYPLLLLDDVMSELDAARREELLAFLRQEKIQTLITATEKAYFPETIAGKVFSVSAGKII